jgi:nicotinate-nucleotide pyrophosphorylase (carboxylating)
MTIHAPELQELIERALAEDVGPGDVTTEATVDEDAHAVAHVSQKAPGAIFGLDVAEATFRTLDHAVQVRRLTAEGAWREGGGVLEATGRARALLTAERTALNFLQRLSGIATQTAQAVQAIEGTGAQVLDTRKTTPGLRALEKAAVRAGGGVNHRAGLYDFILIKENHIALAGGIAEAVRRAAAAAPDLGLEVECRTEEDVDEALDAGAKRLLLDNMEPAQIRAIAERAGAHAELEASGGITLENIREYALAGVQWISVGALTHSAPALDLSLTLDPL